MWKLVQMFPRMRDRNANQGNHCQSGIPLISALELASFAIRDPDALIDFDLRDYSEVEAYPYAIRGALLTFNVNLDALVPLIPPETIVILYGAVDIPARYAFLHLLSKKLSFRATEGGLQSWRAAGLPIEHLKLDDRRPVDG